MVISKIKPESRVEYEIDAWAIQNNWSLDRFDSKATFSRSQGRYSRNKGMKVGTPDRIGCDSFGNAVYLELKAPGKTKVCRVEQYRFLSRKLELHCFCMVVDSPQALDAIYRAWIKLRSESKEKASEYLKGLLPKKVLVNKKVVSLTA